MEKNPFVGGRMNSEYQFFNDKSFRFDVGPSLLLLPDVYKETFSALSDGQFHNVPEFLPVHPFYRVYFEEDNTYVDISNDMMHMKQQIECQFHHFIAILSIQVF